MQELSSVHLNHLYQFRTRVAVCNQLFIYQPVNIFIINTSLIRFRIYLDAQRWLVLYTKFYLSKNYFNIHILYKLCIIVITTTQSFKVINLGM